MAKQKLSYEELQCLNKQLKQQVISLKKKEKLLKIKEDILFQNERKYKTLVEASPEAITVTDLEGIITFVSQRTLELHGYSRKKELIGKSSFDLISKEFFKDAKKDLMHAFKKGQIRNKEILLVKKDGTIFPGEMSTKAILNEEGEPDSLMSLTKDISGKKNAEKELEIARDEIQEIINRSIVGIFRTEISGNVIYANPAILKMLGFSSLKDFNKVGLQNIYKNPKDRERLMELVKKGLVEDFRTQVKNTRNELVDITMNIYPIYSKEGKLKFLEGNILDITEKNKAEEELRESEFFLSETQKIAQMGGWKLNPELDILYWTEGVYDIIEAPLGYQPGVKEGIKYYAPEYIPILQTKLMECFKQGKPFNLECEVITTSGKRKWTEVRGLARINEGQITYVIGTFQDITKRKHSEELLKIEQAFTDKTIQSIPELFYILDFDNLEFVRRNLNWSKITGYSEDELKSMNALDFLADKELASERIAEVFAKGSSSMENYLLTKLGKKIPFYFTGDKFEVDNKFYLVGIGQNISERIAAEEAIRKSEQNLRITLDSIGDAVISTDNKGKIVRMNPMAETLTGWTSEEANGLLLSKVFNIYNSKTKKKANNPVNKVIKSGEIVGLANHTTLISKSGKEHQISDSAAPIRDNNRNISGVVLVFRDITEEYLIKEALQKSERTFRSIIESSPMGVHLYKLEDDDRLVFTGANPAADKLLGVDNSIYIGKTIEEAFPPLAETEIPTRYKEAACKGISWSTEQIVYDHDKITGAFEVYVFQISLGRSAVLFNDVTERKQAEEALRQKNQDLDTLNKEYESLNEELIQTNEELHKSRNKAEESNRLKTEFINNMSHEIRTPMNAIMGFSAFLSEPGLSNDKHDHFVNIIQKSGAQLLRIIDDIMEISKLGTKQVKIQRNTLCLNVFLQEMYTVFEVKAKEKNISFKLVKPLSDNESIIVSDETKLNKILSNLLENSLKFTDIGFIEIGYQIEGSEIQIYVKDTGVGIREEKQKLVFERFSQEEKDLSRNLGGLGLGLSIAKENAELLGGRITVKSIKGEGATFYVTIPYKDVERRSEKSSKNKTKDISNTVNKKSTILVVEDEKINYMYIEKLINDRTDIDSTIIYAKDGNEAVEICRTNNEIDFILMDLKMPVLNGYEATKLIKQIRPDLKVIAQTAYSTKDEEYKANEAGCIDFMSKPISKETFNSIIDRHLLNK